MSAGGLRVERLSVALPMDGRPVPVVREVSFALGPGETLGIVGESGSGKTMVALALTGLLPDEALASGAVSLGGRQLLGAPERIWRKIRGRRIGIVFQEPMTALNPTMPVGAQVAEAMRLHLGLSASEAGARSRALLRRVGMPRGEDWTARYPHQLSGGQRQRVAIAIALSAGPEILIADEPTTALDVTLQAQVLDLLADLVREEGLSLLLVSHDLAVVAELCRRVAVLYAGQVVELGDTAEVLARPMHPYTAGLLACSPDVSAPRALRLPSLPGAVPAAREWPASCAFAPRCVRAAPECRAAPVPERAQWGRLLRCLDPLGPA